LRPARLAQEDFFGCAVTGMLLRSTIYARMGFKRTFEHDGKTLLVPEELLSTRDLKKFVRQHDLPPGVIEIYERELARRAGRPSMVTQLRRTLVTAVRRVFGVQ